VAHSLAYFTLLPSCRHLKSHLFILKVIPLPAMHPPIAELPDTTIQVPTLVKNNLKWWETLFLGT